MREGAGSGGWAGELHSPSLPHVSSKSSVFLLLLRRLCDGEN